MKRDRSCLGSRVAEVIIAGTGVSGGMKPDENLEKDLSKLAIEFIEAPNYEAIKIFNKLVPGKRVGAEKRNKINLDSF